MDLVKEEFIEKTMGYAKIKQEANDTDSLKASNGQRMPEDVKTVIKTKEILQSKGPKNGGKKLQITKKIKKVREPKKIPQKRNKD